MMILSRLVLSEKIIVTRVSSTGAQDPSVEPFGALNRLPLVLF